MKEENKDIINAAIGIPDWKPDINIDFNPGLTVITGETGSGKSIILEAISSLINGKFSKSSIKHGASRSVVELEFDERSYRKIYNKTGRSKSYIDDIPMTQNDFLKSLIPYLFSNLMDLQLLNS